MADSLFPHLLNNLFRLTHHVAHDLRCGFDVVDQTARLAGVQCGVFYITSEARHGWEDPVSHHFHCGPGQGHGTDDTPLTRSLTTGWTACGLPLLDRLIAQDAMGRIRPAHVKEEEIDCIFGLA